MYLTVQIMVFTDFQIIYKVYIFLYYTLENFFNCC